MRPVNKLRELRESRGMTLVQVANLTGVSKKHVFCIETGRTTPSIEFLLRFRVALCCSLDDIYPYLDTDIVYPQGLRAKLAVSA